MAKAGFYEEDSNSAICFSCSVWINTWEEGDDPIEKHKRFSPECYFINGKEVSIDTASLEGPVRLPNRLQPNSFAPSSKLDVPMSLSYMLDKTIEDPPLKPSLLPATGRKVIPFFHTLEVPPALSGMTLDPVAFYALMKKESERRKTFAYGGWLLEAPTPAQMARGGFFNCLLGGYVQCAFCSLLVTNWPAYHSPNRVHLTHSPRCPFYLGDNCGNIPMLSEEDDQQIVVRTLECTICNDTTKLREVVFFPCKHLSACVMCGMNPLLSHCNICMTEIPNKERVFVP